MKIKSTILIYSMAMLAPLVGLAQSPDLGTIIRIAQEDDDENLELNYRTIQKASIEDNLCELIGEDGTGGRLQAEDEDIRELASLDLLQTLTRSSLTGSQRQMLLGVLIGEDGRGGLSQSDNERLREVAARGIPYTTFKKAFADGQEASLVRALLGEGDMKGLAQDSDEWVRDSAAGTLHFFLNYNYSLTQRHNFMERLLVALLGNEEYSVVGLAQDESFSARVIASKIVGILLDDRHDYSAMLTEDQKKALHQAALVCKRGIEELNADLRASQSWNPFQWLL